MGSVDCSLLRMIHIDKVEVKTPGDKEDKVGVLVINYKVLLASIYIGAYNPSKDQLYNNYNVCSR